jgi:hypothetical protein
LFTTAAVIACGDTVEHRHARAPHPLEHRLATRHELLRRALV